MAKVTGIGGVFLKAKDPKALLAWYVEHLGIATTPWGGVQFVWNESDAPEDEGGSTAFSFVKDSPGQAAINFRVDDLDALLEKLTAAGVEIDPKRDNYDFGKFAWFTDPEGNRVELWQPLKH